MGHKTIALTPYFYAVWGRLTPMECQVLVLYLSGTQPSLREAARKLRMLSELSREGDHGAEGGGNTA